ncbi:MAG TPA: hypothetical protein VLS89_19815 [Candidatus Nanopelagicales bacterium]|nr:hypothetical protein [Candidatus Nanopelagicales bacterium]
MAASTVAGAWRVAALASSSRIKTLSTAGATTLFSQRFTAMRRAGHASLSTTMIYVREAENIESPVSDVFPPLPYPLVSSEETSEGPATWGLTRGNYYKSNSVPSGVRPAVHAPNRLIHQQLLPLPLGFVA